MIKKLTVIYLVLCILSTIGFAFSVGADENIPITYWTDDEFVGTGFADESGDGDTEETAYLIENAQQLAYLAKTVNEGNNYDGKYFRITADIDLKDHLWTPIGDYDGWQALAQFKAKVFDGDNYEIKNLTICSEDEKAKGLFGVVNASNPEGGDSKVIIKNVKITDCNIASSYFSGALVGNASYVKLNVVNCSASGKIGTLNERFPLIAGGLFGYICVSSEIENCSANVEVSGQYAGGFVGDAGEGVKYINCYSTGNVNGSVNAGGFAGNYYTGTTFENCYATGNVFGNDNVGGFASQGGEKNSFINCYATGNVFGNNHVGGFIGHDETSEMLKTENCYATGNVEGIDYVGGFIGRLSSPAQISNSYSKGNITGNGYVGGFIGSIDNMRSGIEYTEIRRCYSSGNVLGNDYVGGFIGNNKNILNYGYDEIYGITEHCYSVGDVQGNNHIGGFIGQNEGVVSRCYTIGNVTGLLEDVGAFLGSYNPIYRWSAYTSGVTASHYIPEINGDMPNCPYDIWEEVWGMQPRTIEYMKSETAITSLGTNWQADITPNINNGYPILKWQVSTPIDAEFSITDLSKVYTGIPQAPTITNDKGLVENTDYIVTYNGNSEEPIETGTYAVEITVTNQYFTAVGQTSASFEIYKRSSGSASSGVGQITATPTANIQSGEVSKGTEIVLSCPTEGASIYYTLDGKNPTVNSTLYTVPIVIDKDTNIKFMALKSGFSSSQIATFNYTVSSDGVINNSTDFSIKENASTIKYMSGYNDNTFKPDQAITRYEMLEALNNLLDFKNDGSHNLTDVTADYDKLVSLFTGAGIIEGYEDNTFKGTAGLTRAEFVKIMSVILDLEIEASVENKFTDISTHWANDYINSFADLNYLKGYDDGTFKPDNKLTRAEFVTIINRIINLNTENENNHFNDLTSDHWAYNDILKVYIK